MKKYIIIGNAQSVHLVKWAEELVKYFDVYVISSTTTHNNIVAIVPERNIFNLDIPVKEEGGNTGLLKKVFTVRRIIKKIKPDFVNPHYITSHGLLAAIIKKTTNLKFKLIQSAWGTDILVTPFKSSLYYTITKFCLNAADLATSDSDYMTKVINKISPVKTSTFIFGLDRIPDVLNQDKDENSYYSNRILSENYNIEDVIRFFSKISNNNKDARLAISNDGPLKAELERLVEKLKIEDKVSFKGFISLEEQVLLYKKAQFYISVPTSDSTSVSLIEALAYGCIPIVSDIPANREWIIDGRNGIFYKPSLTYKSVNSILNNKEIVFKENRKIVEEKAIFPKSIAEYVDTINKL